MASIPSFANNNLTQIFLALLPDSHSGQNIGKKEKLSEIQDLLKYGVNVNTEIRPGYTPLCKVIEEGGSKSLVELLLHYGASVISLTGGFEWQDVDGQIITSKVFALARQRSIRCQDKESLDIQHLIQKHLIQNHLSNSIDSNFSKENSLQNEEFDILLPPPKANISSLPSVDIFIKKKLYIFALEHTLIHQDFHHILKEMGVAPTRASKDLTDFLIEKYGLRNKQTLLQIFKSILKNGDCISIATQSKYPETVYAVLIALGLSNDELDQIYYCAEDATKESDLTMGKNLKILQAMLHFEITDIHAVYMIDPEQTNLQIAKAKLNIPQNNLIKVEKTDENYLLQIKSTIKNPSILEDEKLPTSMNQSEPSSHAKATHVEEDLPLAQREPLKVWTTSSIPYINFNSLKSK